MAEYKEGMSGVSRLIILLAVLLLLIGAFFGVKAWNVHQEEVEKGTLALSYDPEDVVTFEYTLDGAEYSFSREKDGTWSYDQDPSLTLDPDAVNTMLSSASSVYAETVVSEDLDDLETYGLDSPTFTLDLVLEDGTEPGLYEGSVNSMSGVTYACVKGDDSILALTTSISGSFSPVNDLLEEEETAEISE